LTIPIGRTIDGVLGKQQHHTNMKSWKTTLSGVATILGGVAGAIKLYLSGNVGEAITVGFTAITTGIGLIAARDNNVSSEQAGAK
jgi:hypothetical protein